MSGSDLEVPSAGAADAAPAASAASAAAVDTATSTAGRLPTCVLIIGMAGSGKTTTLERMQAFLATRGDEGDLSQINEGDSDVDTEVAKDVSAALENLRLLNKTADAAPETDTGVAETLDQGAYIVNLDPAVQYLPYSPNIDIRDTVNYKEVMKKYKMGPNGAIMTSLNLFATKFDQVLNLISRRCAPDEKSAGESEAKTTPLPETPAAQSSPPKYVIIDTPGQIEAFTWSASGQIFTEALANTFPTVMVFVVDTPRTVDTPATFMANMLFACSIMYRARGIPFILAFNKIDVAGASADEAIEWMRDYEKFQQHLNMSGDRSNGDGTFEQPFVNSFASSMSLFLEEFYSALEAVPVSAGTGEGFPALFEAIDRGRKTYEAEYGLELAKRLKQREEKKREMKTTDMSRFLRDLASQESRGKSESQSQSQSQID